MGTENKKETPQPPCLLLLFMLEEHFAIGIQHYLKRTDGTNLSNINFEKMGDLQVNFIRTRCCSILPAVRPTSTILPLST